MGPVLFFRCSGRTGPDYSRKAFDSFLVDRGSIVRCDIGLEEVESYSRCRRIDLDNAVVLPGFTDAHVHVLHTAVMAVGCDLGGAKDISEVCDRLRAAARRNDEPWLLGWNLDESTLAERRWPTVREIDTVSPDHHVWISRTDLHSGMANSRAREWLSLATDQVDKRLAVFAGLLYQQLHALILDNLPRSLVSKGIRQTVQHALRQGVTCVHAMEGGEGFRPASVEFIARELASTPLASVFFHQDPDPSLVLQHGWKQWGGCLLVDGSIGSHTAALREPYADAPENCGSILLSTAALNRLIRLAHQKNLQLALHAIGDAAIASAVDAFLALQKNFPTPARPHRIEHFVLPTDLSIRGAMKAGLAIGIQPAFAARWGGAEGLYERRLGQARAALTNPFRTLLDFGLPLLPGSDSPVTPISPLAGIQALCLHPQEDERLDLNTAIRLWTEGAAAVSGMESRAGKLERGFPATFVCLSRDPFSIDPGRIAEISVQNVFINGISALS